MPNTLCAFATFTLTCSPGVNLFFEGITPVSGVPLDLAGSALNTISTINGAPICVEGSELTALIAGAPIYLQVMTLNYSTAVFPLIGSGKFVPLTPATAFMRSTMRKINGLPVLHALGTQLTFTVSGKASLATTAGPQYDPSPVYNVSLLYPKLNVEPLVTNTI